jgi:DNA-binding MarR family transcriptional regulator
VDLPTGRSIGYLVRETHRAFQRKLQPNIERFGISTGMWWFLRCLWEQEGLSQTELSEKVQVTGPTTVRALALMESRGLITRRHEGSDKRRVFIRLTKEGRELREKVLPAVRRVHEKSVRRLSPQEVDTLRHLLLRVKQALDEETT